MWVRTILYVRGVEKGGLAVRQERLVVMRDTMAFRHGACLEVHTWEGGDTLDSETILAFGL
jgi:hypothetical protein